MGMLAIALVCFLLVGTCLCADLEPHESNSFTEDDKRIPFLFEPHEFTLSCREMKHRCVHNAKGLMILKNECYKSERNEDIQNHLWKRQKASKHVLTGYHICKYYTCRTFAQECKLKAKDRYISTLTCEHHFDHKRKLRYLMDMRCAYSDTCVHRKKECEQNKYGWDVRVNECTEIIKSDQYNLSYITYEEECAYEEPNQWEFDDGLLQYWQDFDVFDYTTHAMRYRKDDTYHMYQERINQLNELRQKYVSKP